MFCPHLVIRRPNRKMRTDTTDRFAYMVDDIANCSGRRDWGKAPPRRCQRRDKGRGRADAGFLAPWQRHGRVSAGRAPAHSRPLRTCRSGLTGLTGEAAVPRGILGNDAPGLDLFSGTALVSGCEATVRRLGKDHRTCQGKDRVQGGCWLRLACLLGSDQAQGRSSSILFMGQPLTSLVRMSAR